MAVVTITDYIDVMDGDMEHGLLLKLFTSATSPVGIFKFVGADGELAFGKTGELNEAKFLTIGAGTFGSTAKAGDALAVSKYCEVKLAAELPVKTKLYLANSEEGAAGGIVTTATSTSGDELQEIGYVVNDETAGANSKLAIIDISKSSTSIA